MNLFTGGISGIGKARDSSIIFINRIGNSCLTNLNDSSIDPVLSEYNSQFSHQSCLWWLTKKHIFGSRKRPENNLLWVCLFFAFMGVFYTCIRRLESTLFRILVAKLARINHSKTYLGA